MNARLRDRGPFKNIWVQPAAGDAGTALGAALWVDARERGTDERVWQMGHAYLGPAYSDDEIEAFLKWTGVPYRRLTNVAEETADVLVQDKAIAVRQQHISLLRPQRGQVSLPKVPQQSLHVPVAQKRRRSEVFAHRSKCRAKPGCSGRTESLPHQPGQTSFPPAWGST